MPARPIDRLIFVFDADAGRWSAFLDSARKALALKGCSLCALTHGLAGEKPEWRAAKGALGLPVSYVHRDELAGPIAEVARGRLPCVVAERGRAIDLLVTPEELEACGGSLDAFKRLLENRVVPSDSGLS